MDVQVPGEMFALAMEAKKRGMGVVGSTQNILDFIAAKLEDAVERPFPDTLQVSLTCLPQQHICWLFFLKVYRSIRACDWERALL